MKWFGVEKNQHNCREPRMKERGLNTFRLILSDFSFFVRNPCVFKALKLNLFNLMFLIYSSAIYGLWVLRFIW